MCVCVRVCVCVCAYACACACACVCVCVCVVCVPKIRGQSLFSGYFPYFFFFISVNAKYREKRKKGFILKYQVRTSTSNPLTVIEQKFEEQLCLIPDNSTGITWQPGNLPDTDPLCGSKLLWPKHNVVRCRSLEKYKSCDF